MTTPMHDPVRQGRIWDLPVRAFHWLLVLAIGLAWLTAEIGGLLMDWHGRIGLGVLGLLVFRLLWGLLGSTTARFRQFFPTPGRLRAYLAGQWQGIGHNPLGALSVFALLTLVLLQVATGLCANDDITFQGPLAGVVGSDWSDWLTEAHEVTFGLLQVLVGLHVAAIFFHAHVRKHNLLRPMISGQGEVPAGVEPNRGGGVLAFVLATGVAVACVWYVGSGRMASDLQPPPPASSGMDW